MRKETHRTVDYERAQGFITLEAACILPILFSVIYFFLFFFQVISLQESLHAYATRTAKMISSYGVFVNEIMSEKSNEASDGNSLKDILGMESDDPLSEMFEEIDFSLLSEKIIDNYVVQGLFYNNYHDNELVKRCIIGGFKGISFLGSQIQDEDGYVIVRLNYNLKIPILGGTISKLPVIMQVRIRSFQGHAVPSQIDIAGQEESEIVYMTEKGSVYHTNRNCSHLRISVQGIAYARVGQARNKNGAKYYPCEKCMKTPAANPGTVYITKYGTSYHLNSDCSCIKREVKAVSISEVKGMGECKRCQAYHKKGENGE